MLEKLYEGKAKIIYQDEDPRAYRVYFKDDATAFNGEKKAQIAGKGELNAAITAALFTYLGEMGIRHHFIRIIDGRTLLCEKLAMIPAEVVVRNVAAGSLAKRLGLEEGSAMKEPVVELFYKNDALGDPMINRYHLQALGLATFPEVEEMEQIGLLVNEHLRAFFDERNIDLIDFKLEFGRKDGEIVLGDEVTPDTCRLWDKRTREKLDKDRFRRDLGGVTEAYQEMYHRVVQEQ